ncbi:ABC-three component system protein [Janthinobacterium lividum]
MKLNSFVPSAETTIPEPPQPSEMITALAVATGTPISPLVRLTTWDEDTWEEFTLEFVSCIKEKYDKVVRCGGGGDMGRDVIAYTATGWVNYQCKHYSDKLSVAEVVLEVGKLIYYSYNKEYVLPEKYYFISPKGSSTHLIKVINDKTGKSLKEEVLDRWEKSIKTNITSTAKIDLTIDLKKYIDEEVDFTIFDDIPPIRLIELHRSTPYHEIRFGIYSRKRPMPATAPTEVNWGLEQTYVQALLDAFSEYKKSPVNLTSLPMYQKLHTEFNSARNNYFCATSLDLFSRDWLPLSSFQELKEECYEAISPTVNLTYAEGYTRYLKVCEATSQVSYESHPLKFYMKIQDKKGLVHHIVNDKKFSWKNDE